MCVYIYIDKSNYAIEYNKNLGYKFINLRIKMLIINTFSLQNTGTYHECISKKLTAYRF